MKCIKPVTLSTGVTVNCGHCMACRINYTTAWKLRLLYELSNWDRAMFVTLTYDEEHIPRDFSLNKKDPVGFFKRLRSYLDYSNDNRKLKYYCCGEYGEKKDPARPDKEHGRPHYHAIIFGLCPYDDNDRKLVIEAWQHRCEDWQFDRMRKEKCAIQNVTPIDIEYVTGYVQKKLGGDLGKKNYGNDLPPFAIMSKGLGLEFALSNVDRLRRNGFTHINGHKISLPRYYRDKLDIEVDYTQIQPPTVKEVDEKLKYLSDLFIDDMKRLYGIDYSNLTIKDFTDKELSLRTRRFQDWYETHRWQMADRVYKDFEQRQKLRIGL